LVTKHHKMASSEFGFLRATYYRWAQLFPKRFPELCTVKILGVGDLHIENFGTWRDSEGRLVWGVNDFDEACPVPYTNDLVRLATSACLSMTDPSSAIKMDFKEACAEIQNGYVKGIKDPRPFILAEEHRWLRKVVMSKLAGSEAANDVSNPGSDLFGRFLH